MRWMDGSPQPLQRDDRRSFLRANGRPIAIFVVLSAIVACATVWYIYLPSGSSDIYDTLSIHVIQWLPDGKNIVFSSNRFYENRWYIINTDTASSPRFTPLPSPESYSKDISLSPDGARRVTTVPDGSGTYISIENVDGRHRITLPELSSVLGTPSWSPDSKRLAFVSESYDGSLQSNLFVVDANGANLTRLAYDRNMNYQELSWSPDGKQIAFRAISSGTAGVYLIDAKGGDIRRLTPTRITVNSFCWSPDSMRIAFTSPDSIEIYVINVDGSHLRGLMG